MSKNISVFSVIWKIVLCILFLAVVWTLIRWAWLSFDWFPMVKSGIPEIGVPIVLSLLVLFLIWHEISSANDKWENLMTYLITVSSMVIFVNAGYIAKDATTNVISVDKLTDLSREEIRKANYVQVEKIDPDTSSYNYTTDYYIQERSRSADELVFCVYQVCPLKDMEGVFVCSETKGEHNYGLGQSDEKLRRWMADFEYHTRGTIRYNAMMAHFFKVIHQSDNIEQYMETVPSYLKYGDAASAKKDVILLEISNPDRVDGYWNNVVIVLVTLTILVVILVLILGFTGGVSLSEYNESRRDYYKILLYFSRNGNIFVLLPPLIMIGWGLYMILNGYNPLASNHVLFDESGACTPDSLIVDGEWWRIFTSMFIHRDFMHIFGNLFGYGLGVYALTHYLYGRDITLVFLISGALSMAFAVLYSQHSVIGASGGVFGLFGAFLSLFIWDWLFGKRDSDWPVAWFLIIIVVLVSSLIVSFRSDISMSGHLSGLVFGALVGWMFRFIYHFFGVSYKR